MKKIKLVCGNCFDIFERNKGEYNRSQKLKRKNFCCQSCASKYWNKYRKKPARRTCSKEHRQKISETKRDEFSPFREHLKRAKNRSAKKQKTCNLTLGYLKGVWEKQKGVCVYAKIKMYLPQTTNESQQEQIKPNWASLDRIDSNKPYEKGNVQFVCVAINFAKNKFSDQEMKDFIKKIK